MNLKTQAIILLIVTVMAFLTGWRVEAWRRDSIELSLQEKSEAARREKEVATVALTGVYEKDLAALRAKNQALSRSKRDATVPDCNLPSGSIGLLKGSIPPRSIAP